MKWKYIYVEYTWNIYNGQRAGIIADKQQALFH